MFEIYTYGNNDTLWTTLNAIASLMGSDDYMGLVRLIALLAFFLMMVGGAMTQRLNNLGWFIGLAVVYMVMFVPKTDVIVINRVQGFIGGSMSTSTSVVSNVPLGFAVFAHLTSKIGDYMTRSFETVFALPQELAYSGNGVLWGNKLYNITARMEFLSPTLKRDLNSFMRNCAYYDILQGRYDLGQLVSTTDLWATMADTNPSRMTTLFDPGVLQEQIVACDDAYATLSARIVTATYESMRYYGGQANPDQSGLLGYLYFWSQPEAVYGSLVQISSDTQSLLMQRMVANTVKNSGMVLGQELNDPSTVQIALASAQAEATAALSYKSTAKIAEEVLPMIRNVIEVVVYACFPFVFLLLLLPPLIAAQAFKGYIMTLLWIQTWPMLYAVLNFVATNHSTKSMVAARGTDAGITLRNISDMDASSLSEQSLAAWMVLAIPVIATVLVKGLEAGLGGLAGSAMSPATGAVGAAAGAIATGNMSYGNVNMGNESAFNANSFKSDRSGSYTDSNMMSFRNAAGLSTFDSNGDMRNQTNIPKLKATPTFTAQQQEQAQQTASLADTNSNAAAIRKYKADSNNTSFDQSAQVGISAKHSNDLKKETAIADQINQEYFKGKSFDKAADLAAGISLPAFVKKYAPVDAKGGIDVAWATKVQSAHKYAETARQSSGISDSRSIADNYSTDSKYQQSRNGQDTNSTEFGKQRQIAAEARSLHSNMVSANAGTNTNLSYEFGEYLQSKGFSAEGINNMDAATMAVHAQNFSEQYAGTKLAKLSKGIISRSGYAPSTQDMINPPSAAMRAGMGTPDYKPVTGVVPDSANVKGRAGNGIKGNTQEIRLGGTKLQNEAGGRGQEGINEFDPSDKNAPKSQILMQTGLFGQQDAGPKPEHNRKQGHQPQSSSTQSDQHSSEPGSSPGSAGGKEPPGLPPRG